MLAATFVIGLIRGIYGHTIYPLGYRKSIPTPLDYNVRLQSYDFFSTYTNFSFFF